MGIVVQAHDEALDRRVAIKFLLPQYSRNAEATERFLREARAAVKIQSEHVARIIDVGKMDTGSPYMVMEFLEGADLSAVIETSGKLGTEESALYLVQACDAIAEAHAQGIVHRDLKPANLFLARQPGGARKIKVLDFGISKTVDSDPKSASLTRTSATMGSPLYMSPEQMRSTKDVDARTDIWALGVILYEALSGQTPFGGNSIPEISANILLETPTPLSDALPGAPAELCVVVARCLEKKPEDRYESVGDLAQALLPFAPERARSNVERIARVLGAAGMATAEFQARVKPHGKTQAGVGGALPAAEESESPAASRTGAAMEETVANFGQTQGLIPKKYGLKGFLLAGGVVAAVGAASLTALLFGSSPAAKAAASSASPAGAAPEPPPAAAKEASPAGQGQPSATAAGGRASADEPAAERRRSGAASEPQEGAAGVEARARVALVDGATDGELEPTAGGTASEREESRAGEPRASVDEPSRPAQAAPATRRTKPSSRRSRSARKRPRPAKTATKISPPQKTHTGDFKSRFGSRK